MSSRWLLLPLLFASIFSAGQPTARLYLKKNRFVKGEPIFLYYEITNPGPETVKVSQSSAYSFCSGFTIHVSSDRLPSDRCFDRLVSASCLSSDTAIAPNESRTEQILLNYEHNLDSTGFYEVEASRSTKYVDAKLPYYESTGAMVEAHAMLHLEIDESAPVDPKVWDDLVTQLNSEDLIIKTEAARVLATMAPASLEDLLLTFKDKPSLKQFAPLALYRLHTQRSMAALAEMLVHSEPVSFEASESLEYLEKSGDPKWLPIIKEAERQQNDACHGCRENRALFCKGNY
jgi:hypothetical protein